jgi:hypothetical protein
MIKTETDPNIIDLWDDSMPLPAGQPYNDSSVLEIDGRLYESHDAFIVDVYNNGRAYLGDSSYTLTGVRVNALGVEVFYKDEEGVERDLYFDVKYRDIQVLVK